MNWQERLILIAEDNDDDYFLWERALKKAQIINPVRRVKDGQEVVQYLSGMAPYSDRGANPFPYFVLLDLKMPVKHGFDTLEWIRGSEATKLLPVVIFSSSQQTADIRRGYELGANGFVTKATSVDGLVTIGSALQAYWLKVNCAEADV